MAKSLQWEKHRSLDKQAKNVLFTARAENFVDWDRRGETQQRHGNVGFRSSTQPTYLRIFTQNLR
ncbi:hypothetical protein F7734_35690 [Scytonema sp. UIC 10036]|uniref:hypothetical protein n=1 Tax=Scytonema sp. UIC 10036 TaxID=2304196 RepID=UPI0012DA8C5F|nr:hypothetical protein [Scytonema sp. UIC 10036]MUG97385.1 hypothetical protein [Scytonema sp. UIC 10036]